MSRTTRKRWVFSPADLDMHFVKNARDSSCKSYCSCKWGNSHEKRKDRRRAARDLQQTPTVEEANFELARDDQ